MLEAKVVRVAGIECICTLDNTASSRENGSLACTKLPLETTRIDLSGRARIAAARPALSVRQWPYAALKIGSGTTRW